ncbi:MAG: type II secretion system F family protein [Spongiibacteraceae bacterium]
MFWIGLTLLIVGLGVVLILLFTVEKTPEEAKATATEVDALSLPVPLEEFLANNGVELPAIVVYTVIVLAVTTALLCLILMPLKAALLITFGILGLLFLSVKVIGGNRRAKMLEQLPSFINQVTRRLSAGVSVENAFSDSVETLEAPLGTVMKRVVRRVRLGYELHQAFDREATTTQLKEFTILATSIRINEQYGGSISTILNDIVSILRLEEAGKQELSALTGETRFTAMVLAVLPPGIAGYTYTQNPNFITDMWSDPSGQSLLLTAVGMEILGVLILWRMIKSVGS